MSHEIKIKCKGSTTLHYRDLLAYQGNLKTMSTENYNRLRNNILNNGFAFAISVWLSPDGNKILDGHHRLYVIRKMVEEEGYSVGKLPVVEIQADSELHAKRLVLAGSSTYASIDKQGLYEWMSGMDMDIQELVEDYSLPELDVPSFEQEFFNDLQANRDTDVSDPFSSITRDEYDNRSVKNILLIYPAQQYSNLLEKMDQLLIRLSCENYSDLVQKLVYEEDHRSQA